MGTSFKTVKCVNDSGVVVSSDLSWSEDGVATVNEATKYEVLSSEHWARQILRFSQCYTNRLLTHYLNE